MLKKNTQKKGFWEKRNACLKNLKFIILKLPLSFNKMLKRQLCVLLVGLFLSTQVIAGSPNILYYVSDGNDRLYSIDRTTGVITNIGACGVPNIEAIAMWPAPGNNILYAANSGQLGTLNLNNGAFTALPNQIDGGGTADGALGAQSLNDVDGLAFDARTGILWGSERKGGTGNYDLIFHIDPATGLFVPDAFGPGLDYIVVDGVGVNYDIDDLAINPADGLVYAVSNSGGNDELININSATGAITIVDDLTYGDVEGLDFHNDVGLYGVTGSGATTLYTVNETTAVMTVLYNSLSGADLESCAMLVADANTINGTVWHDADSNQGIGGAEAGLAGVTLDLYFDANGDGVLDAGDFKVQSTIADGSGNYHFYFGTTGDLLVLIDESTLPTGYAMTTVNNYAVSFADAVNFGEVSNNNDFGATNGSDCDNDGIPDFAEGTTDSDGDMVLDECDIDSDNDGIPDNIEGTGDCDGDGILNYKDLDSDNDGIPDAIETNGGIAPVGYDTATGRITGAVGANGMVDAIETALESGISILPNTNTDGDGNLDRCDCDSDNDGIVDAIEAGGSDANMDCVIDSFIDMNDDGYHDPLNSTPLAIPNTDGLTGPNYIDIDSDNDGIDDTREGYSTPPYQEPAFMVDGDGDGMIDFWDISYGGTPILPYDHDEDNVPDYMDTDSDNDTVLDEIEGFDLDKNGVVDTASSTNDVDVDGLDDNYDPNTGTFGGFTTMGLQDSDGDGWQDWRDSDDDNDGTPTALESTDVDNNTVVDYLEFTTSCVTAGPTFSGNGLVVMSNVGFNNSNNTLAAPDGQEASATVGAEIVIELAHLVEHSTDVSVTMSGGASMSIEFSTDNMTWSSPVNGIGSGTVDFPVSILSGARYVRIKRLATGTLTLRIDGLAYSFQSCFADSDGDGIRDNVDVDDDNDGILDVVEVCGVLATDFSCIGADPLADDDSDGAPNYKDADFCTLNIHGVCESLDFDNDGIPDFLDLDADNDGIPDVVEAGGADDNGDGLIDGFADVNMDGITDVFNPCPTCSNIPTPDTDGDGQLDFLDLDADNDGIPDVVEAGGTDTNGDGFVDNNTDVDKDGLADVYDSDDDGTPGVEDVTDPLLVTGADTDNDGLPNSYPNGDTDADGHLDHLDLDADNDGIPDLIEAGGHDPEGDGLVSTALVAWDNDGDGFTGLYDTDDNTIAGTGDGGAALIQTTDLDNDGHLNVPGETMISGGGGNLPVNLDNDGVANHLDLDADNDGILDVTEAGAPDSNNDGYVDNGVGVFVDTDNDGFADNVDGDVGNDNTFETTNPLLITAPDSGGDVDNRLEYAGNGATTDSDGDDVPDFLDVDSDNDGIFDNYEGQSTMGYIPPGTLDTDGDGLLDAYDTESGAAQNGITPYNHDVATGDLIPDYLDLDSDADHIPDAQEAWDDLVDGDSRGDNITTCDVDADGDGLLDCYDRNDANAQIYTWIGEPADDVDGANGTVAGAVFVNNLDVILPDNIGDNASEPDYRDNINACATAKSYYGITDASSGTSTDYEYNAGNGNHEDGAGTQVIRATTYCEPDNDGWYYFYNPLEPENYLFAIKNNGASPNTVAISDLIDYIEIKVAPDPNTRYVMGGNQATVVMERDWSVIYKGTPTIGSSFDVKFYFQQDEMARLDAAATDIVNNATSPVRSDLVWFGKAGGLADGDILATGVVGMIDVTANDPLGIDEGFPGIPDGTTSSTGNGKNYVEFVGLTNLSGGGTAAIQVNYSALPVELSAFVGKVSGCDNQISWVTDSEKDFSHFELQRSSDGRNFKTITKLEAQGGILTKAYQYVDEQGEKISYYRLVMKDLDGSFEYSKVIVLTSDCEVKADAFVIFPNPIAAEQGVLKINLDADAAGEKNFVITDILSRTLLELPLAAGAGKNRLQIDVSDLPAGTYFLNLMGESNKVVSKKFIVME
ncbi:MAG: T9SS type A sorting domain-containing protein [Saprospiraceae bacterium]